MAYCMYLRKSRADLEAEAHGEGETLARHERLLLEVAKRGHYDVTEIYREVVSGETIAARPMVQRLLQEVEDGLWEGVLVVEVERLARGDTIDQGIMAQAFKYSNTRIITPLKVYDPANEIDEEYFEFGLFMSRREYKTINRRLVRGRFASSKEGKWVASYAPYGYERVRVSGGKGWTLRPVDGEVEVVRLIYRLYTSGEETGSGEVKRLGAYAITKRLDELKIRSPHSSPCWSVSTVQGILSNPVYIGKVRYGVNRTKKKIVDKSVVVEHYKSPPEDVVLVNGLHPAIVDEAVFNMAQELTQSRGLPAVPLSSGTVNPLAGLIVCAKCGRRLTLRPNLYDGTLMCPNRACDTIGAKFSLVEKRVLKGLAEWVGKYRLSWSETPEEDGTALDIKSKALKSASSELATLHKQLDRTHDLLEQGVYDTDTFLARSRLLSAKIADAEKSVESLRGEVEEERLRAESRKNFVPKVEHLLEVYDAAPSAQAKNDLLKEVLEKAVYSRDVRGSRWGALDNFELVLFPKLPPKEK